MSATKPLENRVQNFFFRKLIINNIESVKIDIMLCFLNTFISTFTYVDDGRKILLGFFLFLTPVLVILSGPVMGYDGEQG